ncbi:MAG TPA: FKBP-type peptidyl-prolyl cis-trans isomerase [Tepidisphaeraceae bacterium]|jgi:FK506-binding protein 4/5|nr:FKBP-type peptidyl-prolyl cis-trans isomerase [Tepidisphaeraceae bacterium]
MVNGKLIARVAGLGVMVGCMMGADNAATKPVATTQPTEGLKIAVVTPGEGGAKAGDIVFVLYTGKLKDGKVFDATANHGGSPFKFTLGEGKVIKGWDKGLLGMTVGEKRTLTIPPELAYGAAGSPPTIPANATLTFDVELIGLIRLPGATTGK